MPLRPRLPWCRATPVHSLWEKVKPVWHSICPGAILLLPPWREKVGMGGRRAGPGSRHSLWRLSACVCAALLALAIAGAGEPWRYSIEERRSGYPTLSEENHRLQDDDF